MYCGNCGTNNPEGGNFCVECGKPLYQPPAKAIPTRVETLAANRPTATEQGTWQEWENKLHGTLKTMATAPLFLVLIICYSLAQILNLVSISDGSILDGVYDALSEAGISPSIINAMFAEIEEVVTTISIASALPGLLIAIGLWMIYASAKSTNEKIGTGGLELIRWVQIILMCIMCLGVIVVITELASADAELSKYSKYAPELISSISGAIGMMIVVMLIVGAVAVTLYVLILKTISAIGNTLKTSNADSGVSSVVAVICIISGVLSALSVLTSGFTIAGVLQSAASIMFGVQLFTYRNCMRQLENMQYQYRKGTVVKQSSGGSIGGGVGDTPTWEKFL